MLLFVPVIAVLSLALVLSLRLGAQIENCVLATLSAIVIVLFVASLFDLLAVATYALAFLGWAVLPYVFFAFRRDARSIMPVARLITPAFLIVVFYLAKSDYSFYVWDDLGLWTRMTKFLAIYDRMFEGSSFWIGSKSYPPGAALANYFFNKFSGYSEPKALLFHFMLSISAIAVLAAPAARKSLTAGAASVALIFLLVFLFQFSFDDTLVDVLLAMVLGAAFVVALTEESVAAIIVCNSLFCGLLVLLKATGLPFAMVACAVSSISILLRRRDRVLTGRTLVEILIVPAAVIVTHSLWTKFSMSIGGESGSGYLVNGLKTLASALRDDGLTARNSQIVREMYTRLTIGLPAYSGVPLFGIRPTTAIRPIYVLATLTAVSLIVCLLFRKSLASYALTFATIALGAAAFILLLLILYIERFSDYEALQLASFERYLGTYLLAWSALCATLIVTAFIHRMRKPWGPALLLIALLAYYPLLFRLELELGTDVQYRKTNVELPRRQVRRLADHAKQFLKPAETVYFIKQADTGFGIYAFQFEMYENPTQSACWSLGKPYSAADIWTCDVSLEERLKDYTLLVIAAADEAFWRRYANAFDAEERGKSEGVYKIDWAEGDEPVLHLSRIGP
ncbi:hypothetical protein QA645_16980 [Bradyrhizobium sp. CIAT3101]|uniref:hypothetical protein n=1 Tax=Bradyrhizobium sp. CIAT3101 TaxID=439387 RepID=UPI0024B257CD|nr:hypothetical protein [Bradyrhizobium sp. CIAT3101]WFU84366.1 hypothetical protein QA645_16980 [Bradyrhizobium sp. CIAT3101]